MDQTLKIKTSDGTINEVDQAVLCKFSETIKTMVSSCAEPDEKGDREVELQDPPIVLQHIGKETLDLILQWAKYHYSHPIDPVDFDMVPRNERAGHMSEWDKAFISGLNHKQLMAILDAVNFLDIDELNTLACQQLLLNFRRKTVAEIRETLGISDTLSEEFQQRIALENEWIRGSNDRQGQQ